MPQTPLGPDRDQVRILAAAVGQREAARQLGISENTVKSICYRAGDSKTIAVAVATKHENSLHPNAPKPADLIESTLLADGNATKTAAMRYARRTTEHAARLAEDTPDQALAQAGDVKSAVQVAALAGAWAGASGATETVINVAIIGQDVRFNA